MATTFTTTDGTISVTDPLTTFFTPAPWCSTRPYTSTNNGGGITWYQRDLALVHPESYGPLGRTTECYWPNVVFHHSESVRGVYSPGVCPSGYSANATAVAGSPATTSAWCCPYGMALSTSLGGGCTSIVTTPTTIALNPSEITTIQEDFTAVDYYLYIRWADSDLSKFNPPGAPTQARVTAPVSSSSQAPASGATPKNPAPSNTGGAESDSSGGSLSPGAGAGIGVGVAIVVLAILGGIIWLLLKRRKRREHLENWPGGYESAMHLKQDPPYSESGTGSPGDPPIEADSRPRVEVDGSQRIEADGLHRRAELEGEWRGHEMDHWQSLQK